MGIAVNKSLLAWEACKCGEWGFRLRLRCDTRVVVVISKASMDLVGAVDWSDSLTENLDICDSPVTESTTLHHIYTFHGQVSVHTRSFYGQQLRMSRMMSANRSYTWPLIYFAGPDEYFPSSAFRQRYPFAFAVES